MPKLLHFPWLRRLLNKGVNTDVLPELMPDGTAREAINVRPGSITGNAGGAEAIKGEEVVYTVPVGEDPTGYVLIGSCTCNNQLVEFWASESFDGTEIYAPIVRVDGVIVAKSKNIPYVWDRPLQIAVADDFFGTSISDNEDANGVVRGRGVVYPADHNSAPLYWDINQLVTFATSTPQNLAYFGDNYQVGFNSVGLFNTPEFPIHTGNVLAGGVALNTGQYQYALRYVTPNGDRTNIGPWTPLITIPLNQDVRDVEAQSHYPGVSTVGGGPGEPTPYGIEIRFRVDNVFGFQSIEVVRKAYNTADNIGNNTVVATIPIAPNQVSVVTFRDPEDSIASDSQEIITDEELNIKVMAINKPKAVEYSDRRLTYANFETFPKISEGVVFDNQGAGTIFPITQGVCTRYSDPGYNENGPNPRENEGGYTYWNDGYSDPVNNTYLKSFMRGERYGIGVMFWNQFAEQSFVTPVDLGSAPATNEGYLFPNRRDRRDGSSLQYSDGDQGVDPRSRVQAGTDISGGIDNSVYPTFEVFSQGAVGKSTAENQPWSGLSFVNRLTSGGPFSPFGLVGPQSEQVRLSMSPNRQAYTGAPAASVSSGPYDFNYPNVGWLNIQSNNDLPSPNFGSPFGTWEEQVANGSGYSQSNPYAGSVGQRPSGIISAVTGNIWAPRHYALGAAIQGIQNIPSSTKIISVMRTEPAKRVVAQAIGCWNVYNIDTVPSSANTSPADYLKVTRDLVLMVPDFNNAIVEQGIIDLFVSNPSAFKIQLVSPLGFFTEQYSGVTAGALIPSPASDTNNWPPVNQRSDFAVVCQQGGADFLSYAGVQWDDGQQVNNGLLGDGYGAGSDQYVGYGAWRNPVGVSRWSNYSEQGNRVFDIDNVFRTTESGANGQTKYRVTLTEDVYDTQACNASIQVDSNNVAVRNFHEPWYVVNIVFDEAKIANDSIDKYIETGCHIKTESCIGVTPSPIIGPNVATQDFPLLNERLGDVYCNGISLSLPVNDPAANRYVYVDSGQGLKPWLCVTDNAQANADQQAILSSLLSDGSYQLLDGTVIYGVYSIFDAENWSSSSQKQFTGTVRFGQWIDNLNSNNNLLPTPIPADNSRIIVKYDRNEPIRFFGGDCTVSPSLNALFDRNVGLNGFPNANNDFIFTNTDPSEIIENFSLDAFHMPYRRWDKHLEYYLPLGSNGQNGLGIGMPSSFLLGQSWKRQWAIYWDAEQRSAPRYYYSATDGYEWPRIGYLLKWARSFSDLESSSQLYSYNALGGLGLTNLDNIANPVRRGGFLFRSDINTNYIQQAPVSGFGVPFVSSGGEFTEKFYFPTGLVASLEFNQLAQDIPSLRTFLELNLKTISEENGEIKTIASALAGGGRNLYAWTDNGVARVLTNKNVLTGADGGTLGTQSISNYWGQEMWISRNIGIPDQMWQAFVKGYAPTGDGYSDNFFWANRNSLYRMVGDSIIDIGREKFLSYMLPILRGYPRGYVPGTNGFYNAKYNEAWMSFNGVVDENNKTSRKLVIFNPRINDWNGLYTYDFDGHTQVGNDVFGHRGLQTFKLDQGWTINATTREASVTVPMVGDIDTFKEFIRWRVVGSKPDSMEILDPDLVLMSRMDAATNGSPLWVKEYDGWEGWASRTLASYPPGDRKLPQKRYFYLRLIWNREEDVNATSLSGQLKPIK